MIGHPKNRHLINLIYRLLIIVFEVCQATLDPESGSNIHTYIPNPDSIFTHIFRIRIQYSHIYSESGSNIHTYISNPDHCIDQILDPDFRLIHNSQGDSGFRIRILDSFRFHGYSSQIGIQETDPG